MNISGAGWNAGLTTLQARNGAAGVAGQASAAQETGGSTADPVADVMSRYNLQDISPLEVDQLVKDLQATGYAMNETLLILSTRGAEFISHMSESLGGSFNPNQRMNLISQTENQVRMARSRGDATEAMQNFLDFLKSHDRDRVSAGFANTDLTRETIMREAFAANADRATD